jgi:hypothetical protein
MPQINNFIKKNVDFRCFFIYDIQEVPSLASQVPSPTLGKQILCLSGVSKKERGAKKPPP